MSCPFRTRRGRSTCSSRVTGPRPPATSRAAHARPDSRPVTASPRGPLPRLCASTTGGHPAADRIGVGASKGQRHRLFHGRSRADQVAGGGAAAVVQEAGRHAGRLTGGAPGPVLATSFIRDGCGLPTPPFGSRGGARPTPGRPRCACRALRGQAAAAGSGSAARSPGAVAPR